MVASRVSGRVVGHRLAEHDVQVPDAVRTGPVGQKLGHHCHGHDTGHDGPGMPEAWASSISVNRLGVGGFQMSQKLATLSSVATVSTGPT